jgi:AraC family transcriptional regulator
MFLLNQLPDSKNYNPSMDKGAGIKETTIIDSLTNNYHYPAHYSPMGVLCNLNGSASYVINQRHYTLNDDYFFILNYNSQLEITIRSPKSVRALFVFFDCNIIQSVESGLLTAYDKLLDDPYHDKRQPPNFAERLHHKSEGNIIGAIAGIKQQFSLHTPKEEFFFNLFSRLLQIDFGNQAELKNIHAVRKSTREEIYSRLYTAKFYIDENYSSSSLTLRAISQHAALNSYHFLRSFKELFHITPHQYLTTIRLKRAENLLLKTNETVSEICWHTGFESLASFSLLFKRKYGCSPQAFRKRFRE